MSKIIDDTNCGVHIALAWAVAARNAFDNKSGVSPNQIVFGFNPSVPTIYDSNLPASSFEELSTDIIRKNCDARNKAREIFIKYEANERIRKALRHNVRHTDIEVLQQGDEVLYKRKDNNKWQGPAKVTHIDYSAKTVTVNHGGFLIKAHAVSIMKIPSLDDVLSVENDTADIDVIMCEPQSSTILEEKIPNSPASSPLQQDNSDTALKTTDLNSNAPNYPDFTTSEVSNLPPRNDYEPHHLSQRGKKRHINDNSEIKKMQIGQRFQGIEKNTGKHITGRIIIRAGKVRGMNKFCYNVERDDGWRG